MVGIDQIDRTGNRSIDRAIYMGPEIDGILTKYNRSIDYFIV